MQTQKIIPQILLGCLAFDKFREYFLIFHGHYLPEISPAGYCRCPSRVLPIRPDCAVGYSLAESYHKRRNDNSTKIEDNRGTKQEAVEACLRTIFEMRASFEPDHANTAP